MGGGGVRTMCCVQVWDAVKSRWTSMFINSVVIYSSSQHTCRDRTQFCSEPLEGTTVLQILQRFSSSDQTQAHDELSMTVHVCSWAILYNCCKQKQI